MMPGIAYGLIFCGPFSISVCLVFSSVKSPPSADADEAAGLVALLVGQLELRVVARRGVPAPSANSVKRSISFSFFLSMKRVRLPRLHLARDPHAEAASESKSVMGAMPLSPASSARQVSAVPMPTGVTRPRPVMTTRSMSRHVNPRACSHSVPTPAAHGASRGQLLRYFFACFSM